MRPETYAEINLDNLRFNFEAIRKLVRPAGIIPVVKADAYGHGALEICGALDRRHVYLFAVARLEEAMELRESGVKTSFLIFERLLGDEIKTAVENGFRLTLFDSRDIRRIEGASLKQKASVHVKIDTGMGRVGLFPEQEPDFFDRLANSAACTWEGIYTHFSSADDDDRSYTLFQIKKFREILEKVATKTRRRLLIHAANSPALANFPESRFDAVRPGLLLYGYYPCRSVAGAVTVRPVMTLKTFVAHVRRIPAGFPVSYGRRWVSKKPTNIASLPAGYADGVDRRLTNRGRVLIGGRPYPMVGTVTMDRTMIDVGEDPVKEGDEVVIWGECATGGIDLLEVADSIDTIPYVLTCGVSKRIKRKYSGGGAHSS